MTGTSKSLFEVLFEKQAEFQERVAGVYPGDSPAHFEYHIAAMVEELGEVLKADKRWKTHRNAAFIPAEKLDELADVFITVMNLCLWSGFDYDDLLDAVSKKIQQNFRRLGEK